MKAIQDHRSIRGDLRFCKKKYSRAEIRRLEKRIKKTDFYDCLVTSRESTHRVIRLKFESPEQKELMMAQLEKALAGWLSKSSV